jgi:hypothetical protein
MDRIPVQFRLSDRAHEILDQLSRWQGISKPAVIEMAIRHEMEKEPGGREMKERILDGVAGDPRAGGEE